MKLIIDIDEKRFGDIQRIASIQMRRRSLTCEQIIANGTPLPKEHGKLIDADAGLEGLRKMEVVDEKDKQSVRFAILEYENALTIIEADKTESEDKE